MKLKILNNKNVRRIIVGTMVSDFGTAIQQLALAFFVLDYYQSTTMFATILSMTAIPQIILGLFSGVIIDRYPKKSIMIISDLISGVIVLGFATKSILIGDLSLLDISILVLSLSVVAVFFQPSAKSLVPFLIDYEDQEKVTGTIGLLQSVNQISSIFAPVLAGMLYPVIGIELMLIINGTSFIFSAFCEKRLISSEKVKQKQLDKNSPVTDFKEGFYYFIENRSLMLFVLLSLFFSISVAPFYKMLTPYLSKEVFGASDVVTGSVISVFSIAVLLAPRVSKWMTRKLSITKINLITNMIAALCYIAVGVVAGIQLVRPLGSYSLILFIVLGAIMSVALGSQNIVFGAYITINTDKNVIGRVFSLLRTVMVLMVPIGYFVYGYILKTENSATYIVLIACVQAIATVVIGKKIITLERSNELSERINEAVS